MGDQPVTLLCAVAVEPLKHGQGGHTIGPTGMARTVERIHQNHIAIMRIAVHQADVVTLTYAALVFL